jgi:hypothetical protein
MLVAARMPKPEGPNLRARLDTDVYALLKQMAKDDDRTIAATIQWLIKEEVKRRGMK